MTRSLYMPIIVRNTILKIELGFPAPRRTMLETISQAQFCFIVKDANVIMKVSSFPFPSLLAGNLSLLGIEDG